jgi:invasion protein IalB
MFNRVLTALLLAVPLHATAAEPNVRTVTETYQDWLVVCTEREGNKQCQAQQQLVNKNKQVVVQLTLAKTDKAKQLLQIALPHMMDLTKPVGIVVDGQKARPYPYRYCNKAACFVQVEGNDPLFAILGKGTDGAVRVTPMGAGEQKEQELKFSLKGYAAAAARL